MLARGTAIITKKMEINPGQQYLRLMNEYHVPVI